MTMNPDRWDFIALRANVLGMMGFPTSGSLSVRALPMVNACIKQAHKMIYEESDWYPLVLRTTESLITGVSEYEWPVALDPGRVFRVGVRQASAYGTQYVYPMRPGLREFERNAGLSPAAIPTAQPLYYAVENGMVTISPTPDATVWDALVIEGSAAYVDLVNDADLSCVDGALVAQRAELLARPRLGYPVDKLLVDAHTAYAKNIKDKNCDGRSFMLNDAQAGSYPAWPDLTSGATNWRPPSDVVGP
jgi:hypothetical protein